jgi:subtilisin family serine protease
MLFRLHSRSLPEAAAVRIAVVDSGVHAAHPHVQGVTGGTGFDRDGREHADVVDRLGHGTAVAAAIREKAPRAELIAVKVFDTELATTATALANAIAWSIAQPVTLVNLSLGSSNAAHGDRFFAVLAQAEAAGALIVAAAGQDGTTWLPGSLDSAAVVAVTLDWQCPRDECVISIDLRGRISIAASGWPRPIPGVPPDRNLKGISFAVANATGLVARLIGERSRVDGTWLETRAREWGYTSQSPQR